MTGLTVKSTLIAMLFLGAVTTSLGAAALDVSLADPEWNGEDLPEGQQCHRFGGKDPQSPALRVTQIPPEADALILEFSDRDVARMDNGGHGKVGYWLDGAAQVMVPSVPGHREILSEPFFVVDMHRVPRWDVAGAYLPPCSGGKGNHYVIDVKAVTLGAERQVQSVISSTSVKMAVY